MYFIVSYYDNLILIVHAMTENLSDNFYESHENTTEPEVLMVEAITLDEFQACTEIQEHLIEAPTISSMVQILTQRAQKYFLSKKNQNNSPFPDSMINAISTFGNYAKYIVTGEHTPQHIQTLDRQAAQMRNIMFQTLAKAIANNPSEDISDIAKIELPHLLHAMISMDDMNVARNEYLDPQTPEGEKIKDATDHGRTFGPNTMVQYSAENQKYNEEKLPNQPYKEPFVEKSFAEAYPQQIHAIVTECETIAKKISDMQAELTSTDQKERYKAKGEYYTALATALKGPQINEDQTPEQQSDLWATAEQAWEDADRAMIAQNTDPADAIIHHPIETGYTHTGQRRLDFAIWLPQDANAQYADRFEQLKQETEKTFSKELPNAVMALTSVIPAGGIAKKAPVGKIAPTGMINKDTFGIQIFLKHEGIQNKTEHKNKDLKEYFPHQNLQLTYDDALLYGVTSHELGHAMGNTPTTYDRLTKSLVDQYTEEYKASVLGFMGNVIGPYQRGQIDQHQYVERIQSVLLYMVGTIIESTRSATKGDRLMYFRRDNMLANIVTMQGLLDKNPDGTWNLNTSPKALQSFADGLASEARVLQKLYADGDLGDAQTFLSARLGLSDFARDIMQKENLAPIPESVLAVPQTTANAVNKIIE